MLEQQALARAYIREAVDHWKQEVEESKKMIEVCADPDVRSWHEEKIIYLNPFIERYGGEQHGDKEIHK